jgi:hypothetical protein
MSANKKIAQTDSKLQKVYDGHNSAYNNPAEYKKKKKTLNHTATISISYTTDCHVWIFGVMYRQLWV